MTRAIPGDEQNIDRESLAAPERPAV